MDRLHSRAALLAVGAALLTAAAAYVLIFVLDRLTPGPDRAVVREYVREDTVPLVCVVIREEAALVSSRQRIRPAAEEGARLAAGEAAAISYDSAGEYMRAALLLRLRRELRALECTSPAPAPRELLARRRAGLSAALVQGDLDGANACADALALGLLRSAAEPGRAMALREEIEALEAAGAASFLLTAHGGAVYSSCTDGWEALSPHRLKELDPELLEAVLRAPVLAPSDAGKLVTGGTWLLAALVDGETGALFPPGDEVELRTKAGVFSGEVILLRTESGKAMAVFRCRDAVERVLCDRVLDAQAVTGRTEGLLLPEAAVHREDGGAFVYRIAGSLLIRSEVTPLASLPEGVLAASDALRPGDSVLLGEPEDSGMMVY